MERKGASVARLGLHACVRYGLSNHDLTPWRFDAASSCHNLTMPNVFNSLNTQLVVLITTVISQV